MSKLESEYAFSGETIASCWVELFRCWCWYNKAVGTFIVSSSSSTTADSVCRTSHDWALPVRSPSSLFAYLLLMKHLCLCQDRNLSFYYRDTRKCTLLLRCSARLYKWVSRWIPAWDIWLLGRQFLLLPLLDFAPPQSVAVENQKMLRSRKEKIGKRENWMKSYLMVFPREKIFQFVECGLRVLCSICELNLMISRRWGA